MKFVLQTPFVEHFSMFNLSTEMDWHLPHLPDIAGLRDSSGQHFVAHSTMTGARNGLYWIISLKPEVVDWCDGNLRGDWRLSCPYIEALTINMLHDLSLSFENEDDMVLFALRWL